MTRETKQIIKGRLMSIDALRGFDMLWIIGAETIIHNFNQVFDNPFTNFLHKQMQHAGGFRFEDLIFQLFLFIVGLVMVFSFAGRKQKGHSLLKLHTHIVIRFATLFILGCVYYGLLTFKWDQVVYFGVLQRIALCYLIGGLIVLNTKWKTQAIIAASMLIIYWPILLFVHAPEQLAPFNGGGWHGLVNYIDFSLMGKNYNEGPATTLAAVPIVLIGALAGHWLRSNNSGNKKALYLAIAGVISVIIGITWGGFFMQTSNKLVFPIIKTLSTSSFILYAGGWSLLLLSIFYWIIDVKGCTKWAFFFIVIGMNPLFIYFLQQGAVDFTGIAHYFTSGLINLAGQYGIIILAIATLAVKWLILYVMLKKKIFFKV